MYTNISTLQAHRVAYDLDISYLCADWPFFCFTCRQAGRKPRFVSKPFHKKSGDRRMTFKCQLTSSKGTVVHDSFAWLIAATNAVWHEEKIRAEGKMVLMLFLSVSIKYFILCTIVGTGFYRAPSMNGQFLKKMSYIRHTKLQGAFKETYESEMNLSDFLNYVHSISKTCLYHIRVPVFTISVIPN